MSFFCCEWSEHFVPLAQKLAQQPAITLFFHAKSGTMKNYWNGLSDSIMSAFSVVNFEKIVSVKKNDLNFNLVQTSFNSILSD